jgi:hypothetical protein
MNELQHNWSPDWKGRISDSVQVLGFSNLTDLLAAMPSRPYGDIATLLGNFAPIQIISVQFQEAKLAGKVRDAAKDSLCRNLVEKLPKGWGNGENSEWKSVMALSGWSSEIQVTGGCEELRPILMAVSDALCELPPPKGWSPKGPDDLLIESVFQSHWPIANSSTR